MKVMILAAGLGTRLKPWTLEHPKALVPVEGVPMLERVMLKLKEVGFDEVTVNVHHFAGQIVDFLKENDLGIAYNISDESDGLLDTGGGILKASEYFDDEPVLVHNVDILSDADLKGLMQAHVENGNDITLLTSSRESSRKLIFDTVGNLCGWHNLGNDEYKPQSFVPKDDNVEEAFSGIYVIGPKAVEEMRKYSEEIGKEAFPIMDFFLSFPQGLKIGRVKVIDPVILDIGKPEALAKAAELLCEIRNKK